MKIALPLLVLWASLNVTAGPVAQPPVQGPGAKSNFGQMVSTLAHARNEERKKARDQDCKPEQWESSRVWRWVVVGKAENEFIKEDSLYSVYSCVEHH